jgi:N utilization substance protein B
MSSQKSSAGARTRARELMVQALYQKQIAGHECSELMAQFHEDKAYDRVDKALFDEIMPVICKSQAELELTIADLIDRPLEQLDPVELAILLIGVYELKARIDIPFRVVINEGVNLAKRFGSTDSHKYINACLDKAAATLRETEVSAKRSG